MSSSISSDLTVQPTRSSPGWAHRLSVCGPLVFLIGTPSLFVTRLLYKIHKPSEFINDSPSISGTSSLPPSSEFFKYAMLSVMICGLVFWFLNLRMNADRLQIARQQGRATLGPAILNGLVFACGLHASLWLSLLAIFNLTTGHKIHMMASWFFYFGQVSADLFDALLALWIGRMSAGLETSVEQRGRRHRLTLIGALVVTSLAYLYIYLTKDGMPKADYYWVQVLYVRTEYVVGAMCFLYPVTVFPEMRRHYSKVRVPRSPDGGAALVADRGVA